MALHSDTKRRMQGMINAWRCAVRPRDPAYAEHLHEIAEDVVVTSPKVYESGIITRLDPRLVDLYADCTMANDTHIPAPTEHDLIH